MKRNTFKFAIIIIFGSISSAFSQNVAINGSGNTGNAAAILDLSDASNNTLGMSLTNVDLTNINSANPITTPPVGLIVWNTNNPTITVGGFGAGFYYWSGTQWIYIQNSGTLSNNYIFNQVGVQAGANFNIGANGVIGGTLNVTGLSTLGAVTSVGVASINASGAGSTTIGNATNALTEKGNESINASNGAATTNIGTGTTTGNVTIGGASNSILFPKFVTNSELLYTSGANGTMVATTGGANGNVLTYTGGIPTWSGSSVALTGGPIGSILSNSAANTPAWNATPATGALLTGNAAAVPTWLADVAAGSILISNGIGAAPTWSTTLPAGVIGANNGLTYTSPNVQLGGTLIQATNIAQAGFGLTITGGVINLNTATAFATNIGNGVNALTENGNITLNGTNGAATTNIGTGTTTGAITIGGTAAQTISIGNGAAAKTVNLGSSTGASTTTILSGNGAVNINASNNQPTNINTGTSTGLVTIGNGLNTTITEVGSPININAANTTAPTNIGTGNTTGLITIGGTSAQTISIGSGAANKTVNLGSATTASTTNIRAGTGGINMASGTGGINENTNTNQPTNINSGTSTGAVTIGNSTNTIITESGNYTLNANNGAATTSIGTGATTGGVSIGSASNAILLPAFTTVGDLPYISTITGTLSVLPPSTNGYVLTLVGGLPAWASSGGGGAVSGANNGLTLTGSNVQLGGPLIQNTSVTASSSNYTMNYDLGTGSVAGTGNFTVTNGGASNTYLTVQNSGSVGNPGQVGIGTNTPNASAALDITSTTGGLLPPRLDSTQIVAIPSPAIGLIVFNTTSNCLEVFAGIWTSIACGCRPLAAPGAISGTTQYCAAAAGQAYTCGAVVGATGYIWSISPTIAGTSIVGAGTNATANFAATPETYVISVADTEAGGCQSGYATYTVTVSAPPSAPAIPSGNITPSISTSYTYTVAPVAGATGYTWSVSTTNGTITAGQGTTSVTVLFSSSPATMNICVYASNNGCNSATSCLSVTSSNCAHGNITLNYTGSLQTWNIPACTSQITIAATGAVGGAGGTAANVPGGNGAVITGTFVVTGGDVLDIAVGQQGGNDVDDDGGGGGGGTFVWDNTTSTLLEVGAGGGGGGFEVGDVGGPGSLTTTPTTGSFAGSGGPSSDGTPGVGESGGGAGLSTSGSGGAGYLGNGGNGGAPSTGGLDQAGLFAGGTGDDGTDPGGYGGGGGGGFYGGGGGGGYNGGPGGGLTDTGGGGGGSYCAGTQTGATQTSIGNGTVTITY